MFATDLNNPNCTQQKPVQTKSVLKTLIDEFNLIRMPSSLWGAYIDPNSSDQKFLTISMLNVTEDSLKTSKSVVFSETEDGMLKVEVFMNNTSVEIPYITKNISNISELNNLLMAIDAVGFCKYYSLSSSENRCSIFNLPFMDVCSRCFNATDNNYKGNERKTDVNEMEDIDLNKLRDVTFINNSHQKNDVNKIDNSLCILCNKIFNLEANLSKHYKDHLLKNDDDYFQCTICIQSFQDVCGILEHYRKYHNSVKFIKCSVCNKTFTNAQELRRHTRNHTGYEAFTCSQCKEDFISKQKLRKHTCIKSTSIPRTSKLHICSVCHKHYATNHLLQQHRKEHQIHVSLKCRECNKNFENAELAADHKVRCKKRKLRFACKICGKSFSCVSQRLCHIKAVHHPLNNI